MRCLVNKHLLRETRSLVNILMHKSHPIINSKDVGVTGHKLNQEKLGMD